jgi:zinc transporter 1/2/3
VWSPCPPLLRTKTNPILFYFSLFHSVIIGLALGTATDEFKSLLIAIVFHQLFEGIALGVRIAEVTRFGNWQKYVAAILYPIATPIGIAVGIGIRKSFNANAYKSLLTQGILDSLSAGILFYNGYVELMAFEMNRNAVFRAHNGVRKAALFFAVYLGAAIMAVIGLWA